MDICLVKDMLRAVLQRGLSHDRIALNMAILKDAVAEYQSLTSAAGLDWPRLRISAIVDAHFSLIVDGKTAPSVTRGGSAQALVGNYLNRPRSA